MEKDRNEIILKIGAEEGRFRYLNYLAESSKIDLICGSCHGDVQESYLTDCGHIFCKGFLYLIRLHKKLDYTS